ncbi:unnamed protein product, partial [Discosporangium mesarthrocarpum]
MSMPCAERPEGEGQAAVQLSQVSRDQTWTESRGRDLSDGARSMPARPASLGARPGSWAGACARAGMGMEQGGLSSSTPEGSRVSPPDAYRSLGLNSVARRMDRLEIRSPAILDIPGKEGLTIHPTIAALARASSRGIMLDTGNPAPGDAGGGAQGHNNGSPELNQSRPCSLPLHTRADVASPLPDLALYVGRAQRGGRRGMGGQVWSGE